MTVYELNQSGYASLPRLRGRKLTRAHEELTEFLMKHDGNFFMMLNHETRYFTLYKYTSAGTEHNMASEMISIAESLGTLKAIDINDDIAEFWITGQDDVCRMYAVFNYDKGVIQV